jgi:hypothetical protein
MAHCSSRELFDSVERVSRNCLAMLRRALLFVGLSGGFGKKRRFALDQALLRLPFTLARRRSRCASYHYLSDDRGVRRGVIVAIGWSWGWALNVTSTGTHTGYAGATAGVTLGVGADAHCVWGPVHFSFLLSVSSRASAIGVAERHGHGQLATSIGSR